MDRDNKYLTGNKFAKGNKPNKTSFKNGHTPWNKNKKGLRLSKKTEFKKGVKPYNKLPVGSITIRTDKSGTKRKWIKISEPRKWEPLYLNIWKKNNKTIKKNMVIHHVDFNPLNDDIKNLKQVTRAQHIEIHRKELTKAVK